MADRFESHSSGLESPAGRMKTITPSDTEDLEFSSRSIWVGVGGDVKVTTVEGDTEVIPGVVAGSLLPTRASRVWATGTTASSLMSWW